MKSVSTPNLRRRNLNRRGLTLIELVVVLTILTALGGILVPVIGNMIARTHFAKCAVTIPDITRNITRSFAADLTYPDRWDSLLNTSQALYDDMPGDPTVSGELGTFGLNAGQADGLAAVGITQVIDLIPADTAGDATWASSDAANVRDLGDGETVAVLNKEGASVASLNLKRHFGPDGIEGTADDDATVEYIVFGIGNNSTAVGPSGLFVETPTHFGGEDAMSPVDVYQRYVAIFSVDGGGDVRFECAASVHPDGFDGAEAHVIGYYEETKK